MTYIVPVLIMLGASALFAFLLSFFGVKLQVVRDARVDEVLTNLCGANCGGCGYPGCEGFAKALVEGKADLSACNPTAKAKKDKIAELLGIAASGEDTVAVVNCNGGNKCLNKYEYQGYGSCTTADILAGGNKACVVGCMGLGSCSDVCKYHAITPNKGTLGYATVDETQCTSCGNCISVCPKRIISRIPKKARVYVACSNHCKGKQVSEVCKAGCISCGICAKTCPDGAITLVDGIPVFDYTKCTNCFACVNKCPTKVIKKRN